MDLGRTWVLSVWEDHKKNIIHYTYSNDGIIETSNHCDGLVRPGMLRFMGSQRVGHDWATELNWSSGTRLAMRIFNNHSYMDFEGGCKNNNSWSLKLLQPTNLHVVKSILDKILSHLQRKTKIWKTQPS